MTTEWHREVLGGVPTVWHIPPPPMYSSYVVTEDTWHEENKPGDPYAVLTTRHIHAIAMLPTTRAGFVASVDGEDLFISTGDDGRYKIIRQPSYNRSDTSQQ